MLTYWECYICIALFARRFERRDFFFVRIALTLLEGMVVCYLLAIWYTEADSLLVRVLCYSAITVLNFTALMFCWRDDIEEMLLAFCSGMAAYQFTNKLYPLLQNLRGINDRETLALLHPGDAGISDLDWALFYVFHLLSIVVLALLFTPKNRLVHNRRTTRNVIILSIATVTMVNILICVSRVYEGESPMLNVVTKILYVGFSFTILTFCAGIFFHSVSPLLYIFFALAGMGWAFINVNSYPMVVELSRGSDVGKYTGYYYTVSMASQIFTPVLSNILMEHIGYRTLFPYATFFVLLSFVTMLLVKHGDAKPIAKRGLEALDVDD